MTVIRKRRLHVWEHPSLHPEQQKLRATTPVHVIFEDNEYDFWDMREGTLRIGLVFNIPPNSMPGYINADPFRKEVRYQVSAGMFAKVWEEHYEEEEEDLERTPLFDLAEADVELGARDTFNQRLAPHIQLELPADGHTAVLPAIPDKVDEETGINLTHITKQVDPRLFSPPEVVATRLDLRSPMMMLPLVGQQMVPSAEPLPERATEKTTMPPAVGGQKDSEQSDTAT